jgi:hypothetical protein
VILDDAVGIVVARVGDGARVDTVIVDASLFRRAVAVVPAVLVRARHVGVTGETGRARAHRLVLDAAALGVASAGEVVEAANGGAFLEAAGVRVLTVVVGEALHGDTLEFGIAVEVGLASADWPMLPDVAHGIPSARARVFADGVDARFGAVTLVVAVASGLDGGQGGAASALSRHVAVGADAHNGAHRQRVGDQASRRIDAWHKNGAGILALVFQADGLRGTVRVLHAFGRRQRTAGAVRVAGVANLAAALRDVACHQALGIGRRARVFSDARVETVTSEAGLFLGTLGVSSAADGRATAPVRVALVSGQTAAVGLVATGEAFRVCSARVVDEAGVDAGALDADLSVEAFGVALAADGLALNLRVSNGALWTPAYGPVSRKETLGTGTAVARVPAEPVDTRLVAGALVVTNAPGRVHKLDGNAATVGIGDPADAA